MWKDEVIEEVRKVRREIEEECDNDFGKIFELARAEQGKYGDRIVRAPGRLITETAPDDLATRA